MFLEIANDCALKRRIGASAAVLALASTGARKVKFVRLTEGNVIVQTRLSGDCRVICCCARKSAPRPLAGKGLGRGRRSQRDSGGREAEVVFVWVPGSTHAAVSAIPGGVRRLERYPRVRTPRGAAVSAIPGGVRR